MLIPQEQKRLLVDEIKEIKTIKKGSELRMRELILQCAKKLEVVIEEKRFVSKTVKEILKQAMGDDYDSSIERTIELTLPDDYKINKGNKLDLHPTTPLQEYLVLLEDLGSLFTGLAYKEFIKLKKVNEADSKELESKILDSLNRNVSVEISDLITDVKDTIAKLERDADSIDERELIHEIHRVKIKLNNYELSLHEIGEILGQSAKWQKEIIKGKDSETTNKFLEEIQRCPVCDFDMKDWFNRNAKRVLKGLKVSPPNSTEIEQGISKQISLVISGATGVPVDTVLKVLKSFAKARNPDREYI
ncbi:MAG: hypothetical protein HZC29_08670, partial [Thaumarchaeota archaeon]|nr:hypothetical protein [Nitrososphaerota archaeon]